jgi:hypothetical protein
MAGGIPVPLCGAEAARQGFVSNETSGAGRSVIKFIKSDNKKQGIGFARNL